MFRSRLFVAVGVCSLFLCSVAFAQAPRNDKTAAAPAQTVVIACQNLWDGRSDTLRHDVSIVIQGERIEKMVDHLVKADEAGNYGFQGAKTLHYMSNDPNSTCMPGLIEAHTHILLQGDITAADYDEQILKQSVAFRTILAVRNAKRSLQYGFTTIRDLETEGAGYADVDLKKAINQGIIPGPRMFTSGRAMDVTGAYPVLGYAWELQPHLPKGVQEVDGVEGARKAVREQLSYGVDWIKVYSDRSYNLRPDGVLDDIPTFTVDELRAIVDEAHRERHKVASHATALNGVHNSVVAGVDSIEHGDYIADEDLAMMKQKGTYYVPTLFVGEYVAQGRGGVWPKMIAVNEETVRRAMKAGVKIAFGTDVGGFDWSITPAKQFATLVKVGMTAKQAIQTSTITGAELVGMADQIGTLEPGKLADVIIVPGNPLADVTVLEHVTKTWKGGVAE